jgi:hypothetical protein
MPNKRAAEINQRLFLYKLKSGLFQQAGFIFKMGSL